MQMSSQLASLSHSGNFINSTMPAFALSTPFSPQPSSVRINALWSCSLVISLITASLGILVKQWFHEFMAQGTQDPTYRIRIRFFRSKGLERWQVFEIAAALPLLLQIALLLFFVGLSEFLRELNVIVGWAATGTILGWLGVFIFTTLAPILSSQCPYKTPMLKRPLGYLRTIAQPVYGFIKRYLIGSLWILLCGLIGPCLLGGTRALSSACKFLAFMMSEVRNPPSRLIGSLPEWIRWICITLASFVVLAPISAVLLPLGIAYLTLLIILGWPSCELVAMLYIVFGDSDATLPWKYTPQAEESEMQESDAADSGILVYSDPFFRDRQLRGTLLECSESVPVSEVAKYFGEVQPRSEGEDLICDVLLHNSRLSIKGRRWDDALTSIIQDRSTARRARLLPTLVIRLTRSDLKHGAGAVFQALYSSLVDDQGPVYQSIVERFSGPTRQGDAQCGHLLPVYSQGP